MLRLFFLFSVLIPASAGTLSVIDDRTSELLAQGAGASVLIFPVGEGDAAVVIEASGASCELEPMPIEWAVSIKGFVNLENWDASCRATSSQGNFRFRAKNWRVTRPNDAPAYFTLSGQ